MYLQILSKNPLVSRLSVASQIIKYAEYSGFTAKEKKDVVKSNEIMLKKNKKKK